MEIRKATIDDFKPVLELKLELKEIARKHSKTLPPAIEVKEHYERYLKEHISSHNSAVFVAFEGKKPVAMITAKTYNLLPIFGKGKRGTLSNLFVEEEFRKQGIGKKLIEKAIEWLKSRDAEAATAKIYTANTPSLNLYRSLGFTDFSVKIFKEI